MSSILLLMAYPFFCEFTNFKPFIALKFVYKNSNVFINEWFDDVNLIVSVTEDITLQW